MTANRPMQRRSRLPMAALIAVLVGCGGTAEGGSPGNFVDMGGTGGSAGAAAPTGAGGAGGTEGDVGVDGGRGGTPPEMNADAFTNNPVEMLVADPDRDPFELLGTDVASPSAAQDYVGIAASCYDPADACGSPECGAFASCCTATGNCCEPVFDGALPSVLDFESCEGLDVESCAAGAGSFAEPFGADDPVITARGLVPNGTATAEGGAFLGGPVNLASERITVEAQLALPIGCGGTCVESAGVGFAPFSELGVFEGAEVGLLLSGSRQVVNLLIGGQVADAFDAGSDSTAWQLVLSPQGLVEVLRDGVSQGRYPFEPASLREARLAVFGRNLGADSSSAAVSSLSVLTELCDNPSDWSVRAPLVVSVQGQAAPELMMGSAPSIATDTQGSLIAFEADGAIFVGAQEGLLQVSLSSAVPTVFPTEEFEAGGIGDPELFSFGGELYLFYSAYDANGMGRIGSAVLSGNGVAKSVAPVPVPDSGAVALDSPTIAVRNGLLIMVLRATLQSGATELRAYYSPDPQVGWERIVDGALESLTRIEDATSAIESPSLIIHNSAYQLYYARRTATRWAVELAVSDELLIWRPIGEVLGPSGEGFDTLGARSPDARSLPDGVDLVYAGQDGVSFQLGYAQRTAPAATAPGALQ